MARGVKIKESQLDSLLKVCEESEEYGVYYSKEGDDYIQAIEELLNGKNSNDKPFSVEDIIKQPTLDQFEFPGIREFVYVCDLIAKPLKVDTNEMRRFNEKIVVVEDSFVNEVVKNVFEKALGVDYLITCPIEGTEHIIKIGNSRKTFKDRLSSYNCGVTTNVRTASTTNIKILQSFVATRKKFKLYLMDCSDVTTYTWHGIKSAPFASTKGLAYEDILLKEFIRQFNQKPLANVQADATT